MWYLSSGIFLGWSLGANDAANVFGTAVSANVIRWITAAILTAVFVVVGAIIGGAAGLNTLSGITDQSVQDAFFSMLGAAITVALMTKARLPVSTSQAVVGAIIGLGLMGSGVNWNVLVKIVACWIGTPIGAAIIAYLLHRIIGAVLDRLNLTLSQYDRFVRYSLVIFGIYSAYALGANNVANVTGVFYSAGLLDSFNACLLGSLSIAFGVLTYSKNVMKTVGKGVFPLNTFAALIAVLASACTVHIYAIIGVPVSSSQAIIGAVLGIGVLRGLEMVNVKSLVNIGVGWVCTPVVAGLLTIAISYLAKIRVIIVN